LQKIIYNKKYKVLTDTGWSDFDGVKVSTTESLLKVSTTTSSLTCTPNHLMLTPSGEFKRADSLLVGDLVITVDRPETVESVIASSVAATKVYDLYNVHNNNRYYTNNIVSHNCAEFLGSSNTLIKGRYIKTMAADKPLYSKDGLTIYKHAEEKSQYLITCDVSRGTGNDYSAYIVYDITEYPFRIVSKYTSNQISTQVLPTYLYQTAKAYNDALVLIETNDNGQQVADILFYDLEYENTVFMQGNKQPGCRTTKSTKRLGCSIFKDMVESQKLIINDSDIISEISTFVQQSNDKGYAASSGSHDDLVMCNVMLSYFTTRDEFKLNSDLSLRKELVEQMHKNIEEDLMPFGIFDDGVSEESSTDPWTQWLNN